MFEKFIDTLKGTFERLTTSNNDFQTLKWKAERFDTARQCIKISINSETEHTPVGVFEKSRNVTLKVEVVKILNALGIVVNKSAKLNLIDDRNIESNDLQDETSITRRVAHLSDKILYCCSSI